VLEPLAIVVAIGGGIWGFLADRFATRWPEHELPFEPNRPIGWRTIVVVGMAALALPALLNQFTDPVALAVFGAWFLVLVLILAIDLDQRLMPDELTLPVVPVMLVYALSGANPLVGADLGPAILAAVAIPAVLYLPSIPFGEGAFGIGDVKLLVGVGLAVGMQRAIAGIATGLLFSAVVLVVLLITRRIGRRSYVPFGPFLVAGAFWAVVGPVAG
jgi:leader peptidase (prepilin peptidase)/N-methyltransferase